MKVVEERNVDSYGEYESLANARHFWEKYKELDLEYTAASNEAQERLSRTVNKREACWMTVVQFDEVGIDHWIKTGLNKSGTFLGRKFFDLKDTTIVPLEVSRERLLEHEQNHFDITEAFTKVLRAEMKSMYATLFSPYPSEKDPECYRRDAADLLRTHAASRARRLEVLINATQTRFDNTMSSTAGTWPELKTILQKTENDPNQILIAPILVRSKK